MTPLYIRMSDAPGLFGVADDTLRRWVKDKKIRLRKPGGPGGMALLKVAEVVDYIEASATEMGD